MLYFVIYAPISAITLVSACLGLDCRFTCDEPSNRRKNEVEGDQEELQRKPNRPNSGHPKQNLRTKKCTKTQRSRSVGTGPARGHHRLPVRDTMARAAWCTAVRPWWNGHAFPLARVSSFSTWLFSFQRFLLFYPLKLRYIWTHPIISYRHSTILIHSFRF